MTSDEMNHAVVVGAGLSGLLAAHVLASRFERVTLVERDALSGGEPEFRPGVPQSRHVHILWSRGLAAMDELVPGVRAELEAAGGTVVEAPEQMRWLSAADWFDGVRGTPYLSVSRERLESTLRRRIVTPYQDRADGGRGDVLDGLRGDRPDGSHGGSRDDAYGATYGDAFDARPGITVLGRHEVTGLVPAQGQGGGAGSGGGASQGRGVRPDEDAAPGGDFPRGAAVGAVGGVRVRERGRGGRGAGREFTVNAGLVVVATGRGSRAAQWLLPLGYPAPATERIDAHLGYSSRYFRRPAANGPWKAMYVQGNPDVPRSGVIVPVDGGRWLVTLIGQGEHQPPVQDEEWRAFASTLRSGELAEALAGAEPLSGAVAFRATANEWTHFERARRWPRGLLVLGEALCRFNPVYGHGMTVAALQAKVLADRIATRAPGEVAARARETQKAVAKCARAAWLIATGEDSRYPGTDGPRPGRLGRIQQQYMARVLAAANTDPVVAKAFFAVLSLNRPPETLLTPRIALRLRATPRPA